MEVADLVWLKIEKMGIKFLLMCYQTAFVDNHKNFHATTNHLKAEIIIFSAPNGCRKQGREAHLAHNLLCLYPLGERTCVLERYDLLTAARKTYTVVPITVTAVDAVLLCALHVRMNCLSILEVKVRSLSVWRRDAILSVSRAPLAAAAITLVVEWLWGWRRCVLCVMMRHPCVSVEHRHTESDTKVFES